MTLDNTDGNGNDFSEFTSKYDIASVLLDYVYSILPDEEDLDEDEDIDDLISRALFICATAWNISVLPEDCGNLFISNLKLAYEDSGDTEPWDDLLENLLDISKDMQEQYPDGDCIVADHALEPDEEGEVAFSIDIMPLVDAVAMLRENI